MYIIRYWEVEFEPAKGLVWKFDCLVIYSSCQIFFPVFKQNNLADSVLFKYINPKYYISGHFFHIGRFDLSLLTISRIDVSSSVLKTKRLNFYSASIKSATK